MSIFLENSGDFLREMVEPISFVKWINEHGKGKIEDHVHINTVEFGYNDNPSIPVDTLGVILTLEDNGKHKKVVIEKMPVSEFFKCFKRFHLIMKRSDLTL